MYDILILKSNYKIMNLLERDNITDIWNKLYGAVWKSSEWNNPEESRKIARQWTKEFHEFIKQLGINVNYSFWKDTVNHFPELVEVIQKYINTWEISNKLPLLWLWNHQSFWLEAMWLYDYFPTNGRAVLKDELLLPPYFWKWIESIDPIVYYRRMIKINPKEVLFYILKKIFLDKRWLIWNKERNNQIKNTILEKKAVLIYPEGTRSKNGELLKFRDFLYKPAYDILSKEIDWISNKVALITSDTHDIFPTTLEKVLLRKWEIYSWDVNIKIDIIEIDTWENIKKFNKRVRDIIENNLEKKEQ